MEKTKNKPVRQHEDLIAWQLCSQLRRLVLRYTRTGPASRDPDYRGQLRRAVRSACYNTSEGFYRYKHGEFGNHLNIARGSLGDALDQIDDGAENNYSTFDQHNENAPDLPAGHEVQRRSQTIVGTESTRRPGAKNRCETALRITAEVP